MRLDDSRDGLLENISPFRGIEGPGLRPRLGMVARYGRNALIVPPSDPEAMSRALEQFIEDPGLRQKLGAAARHEVLQRHTWQQHVARLLARIKEFAGART
jgi:glycosyltransferase involved in cell wall biosynthesis